MLRTLYILPGYIISLPLSMIYEQRINKGLMSPEAAETEINSIIYALSFMAYTAFALYVASTKPY